MRNNSAEGHLDHPGPSASTGKPPTATLGFDPRESNTNSSPGLTPTDQLPASAVATVDLEGKTVTEAWRDLFDEPDVREAFIRSVRAFATDRTPADLADALDERDVPAHLHGKIDAVARGDRERAWHLAADVVPSLGSGWSTVEHVLATACLFDALPSTPTLAVRVGQEFRDRRREQREDVCSLLATLARAFDVRLAATRLTRAWLAREHRDDLPGVSEWRSTDPGRGPLGDVVDDALATLDSDGREVCILRTLAETSGETLSYSELYASVSVDDSRVRQCLATLADLGLVATFGPTSDRKAELLEAGRSFLSDLSQQITLADAVSETPHSHTQAVEHALGTAPPDGLDGDAPPDRGPYRIRYMDRPTQHAAVASAPDAGIGLVNTPIPGTEDDDTRRTHLVTYDADRNEGVVSVRATGAMQYTVSTALALSSPRFIDSALPVDRLDAIDDPPEILRDARCIGALSDEALEDGQVLRDALVDWGQEIADLTRDLKEGEYDDRDRLRSAIMRSAHGLAGSIVHLLETAGVGLTREIRVPDGLDADHLGELARSVGISAAIQSRYGAFAAYRQLFESRDDKRRTALTPDVDAADPLGTLIGSFVVRGPDVHRLRPSLESHVGTPRDLADDAPEFGVRVPIRDTDRSAFATAATRILREKNLSSTRSAVSIMQALAGSPYDVARALHQLSPEDRPRDVRPDELRYALATLPAGRILPGFPPTVGAIVAALLPVDERVSQTDLADAADVSTESIRRQRDRLEALGLVDRDGQGYRLALSFQTADERDSPVVPDAVDDDLAAPKELVFDVVADFVEDTSRFGDPDDPVGGAFISYPPDFDRLEACFPDLSPWIDVAKALCNDPGPAPSTVEFGADLEQTPLTATGGPDGGAVT